MTSLPSSRDRTPQPEPEADSGEQLTEDTGATESKDVEPEQLLETDLELWLRHFGVC